MSASASRSDSDSESSGSSGSSSDSSSSHEKKRKKEKKRKREREEKKSRKKHKKESGTRKEKHKKEKHKKKKHKKEKKHKRDKGPAVDPAEAERLAKHGKWGAYGIVREEEYSEKQEEFLAWLSEVKGVPQEHCTRREIQEHFSSYCEDYNTATMPSEKYYNLRAWYLKEQQRKAREGGGERSAAALERTVFDDEAERRAEIRRAQAEKSAAREKLIAQSMAAAPDSSLLADMRAQQSLAQTMRATYQTGDAAAARELIKKLDPKHVSEEQLREVWGSGGGAARKARKPQKQ